MSQDFNMKVADVIEVGILPRDAVPTSSREDSLKPTEDTLTQKGDSASSAVSPGCSTSFLKPPLKKAVEERYVEFMKDLQFEAFDMIVEEPNSDGIQFTVSHHYEKNICAEGGNYPARTRRLAREVISLRNNLPLSNSSSIFLRCDSDRLDVMKFLITGPEDTPYANGCFEFDVYFSTNYPSSPMWVNFRTTGEHSVLFNPNLYPCGKVCLSLLNMWTGKPEETWNPETSTFLQLLVSIQALILVPDPFFNEPGFEELRETEDGTLSSYWFNRSIYAANIRWAMINQLRNPSPCFKSVIQAHFWIKRNEIFRQIDEWIKDFEEDFSEDFETTEEKDFIIRCITGSKILIRHLYEEIAKLHPPPGFEDMAEDISWLPDLTPSEPKPSISGIDPATTSRREKHRTIGCETRGRGRVGKKKQTRRKNKKFAKKI